MINTHATLVRTAVPLLLLLALGALSFAGESSGPQASPAPSIGGTYRLIPRQTPDGTMLRPPEPRLGRRCFGSFFGHVL